MSRHHFTDATTPHHPSRTNATTAAAAAQVKPTDQKKPQGAHIIEIDLSQDKIENKKPNHKQPLSQ
jgi:hypothetical protein